MSADRPPVITLQLARARNAVAVVFALSGLAFASLVSRIPAIRDALGLTPGQVGLVLLAGSAGAVLALPSAGAIVVRLGPARAVTWAAAAACAGMVVVGVAAGAWATVAPVLVGLFVLGAGTGVWDVAMNVKGADVERGLHRSIMPRFHAAFSLGSVGGAALGAAAAALHVPVQVHVSAVAVLVFAAVLLAVQRFTPVVDNRSEDRPPARHPLSAWREIRTVLIGITVLSAALVEGAANDWLALALVDGYGASHAIGAAGFAVFLAAMTAGRVSGTVLLDRWGRVGVVRASFVLAVVGLALFVFGGSLWVALPGAVLWGLGASLGFPVGMSAASDDESFAAPRVSVVASIGYTAFLAGPPLIGLLADHVGVLRALLVIVATLLASLAVTGALRQSPGSSSRAD